jgi:plastocyanin
VITAVKLIQNGLRKPVRLHKPPRTPSQVTALVAQVGAIKVTTAVFNVRYSLKPLGWALNIIFLTECVASMGNPSTTDTPPTPTSVSGSSSSASSTTHTVIVAPTQGVLRYLPFVVNASVGDTVEFHWGANNHTVTKSSSISPCNRTSDGFFTSGTQNKTFVCRVSCLILGFYDL